MMGVPTSADVPRAKDLSAGGIPQVGLPAEPPPDVSQVPGSSLDYARAFGGKQATIDPKAETPAQRPFPEQGNVLKQDGEHYIFRGYYGIPFRCKSVKPPDIKVGDPKQPKIVDDAKVSLFDFTKPDDLKKYTEILDLVAKGRAVLSVEERQWVPEEKSWRVFLRWGLHYWELPDDL